MVTSLKFDQNNQMKINLEKLAQERNLDLGPELDTLLRNDFLEIIWN
tara:strand:+ start:33 stop:173 length:141 start_codon:yes stop_codon:yes gene_type:complete